ncbi:MAG: DUF1080 domain-containing protein [Planctomycetota bacterium]
MMLRTVLFHASVPVLISLCVGDLLGQAGQPPKKPDSQGTGAARVRGGQKQQVPPDSEAVPAAPVTFITDPQAVDGGLPFIAEYLGETTSSTGEMFPYGVQVVQTGKQNYRMRGFVGGLPGAGWDDRLSLRNGAAHWEEGQPFLFMTMPGKVMFVLTEDGMSASVKDELVAWAKQHVRKSPTAGKEPPPGAQVLFGGGGLEALSGGEIVAGGFLRGPFKSLQAFGDQKVHLEFRLPLAPDTGPKQRGMNHVLVQGRYGLSIKDSMAVTNSKHVCGALVDSEEPRINMSFPPLAWQTYDIDFRAARFDAAGQKTEPARMAVWQNGVLIHDDLELENASEEGQPEGPEPGPLVVTSDGCPVFYRNLWVAAGGQ